MSRESTQSSDFDVLILGGGPAGLSAALCLGRARRRVAVIDAGAPRHAVSRGVHNFLTREGMAPAALRQTAWADLAAFPTVARVEARLVGLARIKDRWVAEAVGGARLTAPAALLATGVVDEHPALPGYRERFGHSIHLCPFCHGWESRDQPLGVLASGEAAVHLARLLKNWSADVAVLSHGGPLDATQTAALAAAGIPVYPSPVVSLDGPGRALARIHFADGTALDRTGLFASVTQRQVPVVQALGLKTDPQGYLEVDSQQRTSAPMLWAAGDVTSRFQQVVEAAAQGLRAGAMIHAALTFGPH